MTTAEERLVDLAMLIASATEPVTAAQVRVRVPGYSADQDEAAFLRMFERDKESLRAAGLVIEVDRSGDAEAYRLDRAATYSEDLHLTAEEAMLVRAAGAAMLADPAFPFALDLRMALAKIAAASGSSPVPVTGPAPVAAATADEAPEAQGEAVATLTAAAGSRKRASFDYTNTQGRKARRTVEPYGLFARDGRWYLVARDVDADGMRVYALARVRDLTVNAAKPKTPDFEPPEHFDVAEWAGPPFQWGPADTVARLGFSGPAARRAEVLAGGWGHLTPAADGSVDWTVAVADLRSLAEWAVANGPGITILEPAEARSMLAEGLARVVADHGA